jgi:hypothetical protein
MIQENTSLLGNIEFSVRFHGERRYRPGGRIAGQVTLSAREPWQVAFAEAILFFRTEGMGNRDEGRTGLVTLAPPDRDIMRTLESPFEFQAPPVPSTYYGSLLKVHWMVGFYAQSKGGKVHGLLEVPVIIHREPDTLELPEVFPGNAGKPVTLARF